MEENIKQLQRDVRTLNEAVVEHRVRLENGTRVFAQQREFLKRVNDRVDHVEERLQPKPLSVVKIVAVSFSIFVTLSGALWYLSERLADRPTTDQIHKVMADHDKNGHPKIHEQISNIREDLVVQRGLIKEVRDDQADIRTAQKDADSKLDDLLRRVPRRRRSQ